MSPKGGASLRDTSRKDLSLSNQGVGFAAASVWETYRSKLAVSEAFALEQGKTNEKSDCDEGLNFKLDVGHYQLDQQAAS